MTPEDGVPLPSNVYPGTNTVLAFDNIDRLEGTLSGGETSHRVNGIAVQPVTDQKIVVPKVEKTKKRSFSAPEERLPIYNVGKRVGAPPILSTPALFYAESRELLAKSRMLVYYRFMLIMQNSRSRDSLKLLLQHFHHIFLKSTHDKL